MYPNCSTALYCENEIGLIYRDGKWATIIPEDKKPIFTTTDGVDIYEGDIFYILSGRIPLPFPVIAFMSGYYNTVTFSTYQSAQNWIDSHKPISLIPDQLVDGEIYVDEDGGATSTFRAKSGSDNKFPLFYSRLICDDFVQGIWKVAYRFLRPATLSEKQQLIKAEVEYGYFHALK